MLLILLAAVIVRLPFVLLIGDGVNADEAWTGLMSFSVLRGEYPVFMPGLGYMGSIEAFATAVLFWLFGPSARLMYAVPTAVSVVLVLLAARLGRQIAGRRGEILSGLFAAVPPVFLVVFGNAPRLGYVETLLWGMILLLMVERLMAAPDGPRVRSLLLVSGFVAGIAVWTNLLIAPFAATAVIAVLVFRGRAVLGRAAGWGAAGLFAGSLPFWVFNIRNRFWSLALMETGEKGDLAEKAGRLLGEVLPFVLGMRDISAGEWLARAAIPLAVGYLLVVAGLVAFWRGTSAASGGRKAAVLPFALLFLTLAAFLASRYGSLGSPRYLFPVYGAMPLLLAMGTSSLWRRSRAWLLVVPLILGGHLVGVARAYQEFVFPGAGDAEIPPLRPVLDFLEHEQIRHVYADYGVSVRFNFETGEKVAAAQPLDERYPPNALAVDEASRVAVAEIGRFTFFGRQAFKKNLKALGFEFEEALAGDWRIFYAFRHAGQSSASLSPELWRAETSEASNDPRLAFDRDVTTRWGSGKPRQNGIWYLLDLGKIEMVRQVVLLPGIFLTDRPIGLRIEASPDKRAWKTVWELGEIMPGLHVRGGQPRFDASGGVEAVFAPIRARYLRFTHLGSRPPFDWSIGEIFVYSRADEDGGRGASQSLVKARRDLSLGRTEKGMERLSCVLALDPENAEAHRLKSMIVAGVRP